MTQSDDRATGAGRGAFETLQHGVVLEAIAQAVVHVLVVKAVCGCHGRSNEVCLCHGLGGRDVGQALLRLDGLRTRMSNST